MSEPSPEPAAVPEAGADPASRRRAMRGGTIVAAIVLVLLALGAGRTVLSRMANAKVLDESAAEQTVQYVKTTFAKPSGSGQTLALPGTLQGAQQSPIAARATGYLKRLTKDIGASVEKGELLAEIESPEIDQQLSQAIAARQQTAASLALAKSTTERWEALKKRDVVSQQELDEKRSAAAQANANLAAADANVERLRQMQGFTRVTAPFSGVITRRAVDAGDLIDSGGKTLFVLTQMDPLKIYVNVPQSYAQLVKQGQKVVVTQAELRGKTFAGEVARTAGSIDTATRTMQVEIKLANRDGALCPAPSCTWPCRSRQPGAGGADQRAAVPQRRHARRRGRCREQGAAAGGDPRPQPRRGDRDRRRHRPTRPARGESLGLARRGRPGGGQRRRRRCRGCRHGRLRTAAPARPERA